MQNILWSNCHVVQTRVFEAIIASNLVESILYWDVLRYHEINRPQLVLQIITLSQKMIFENICIKNPRKNSFYFLLFL